MSRNKLKCGGRRKKAMLGADGAVMAAATLVSAGMTTAATIKAAKDQAKATEQSASINAKAIEQQNQNNTQLNKETIAAQKQMNQETNQLQQDENMTLQMMAGQQNMADRQEASKVAVKYGGRPKRRKLKSTTSYGGSNNLFKVTDGGGVIPIQVDNNGYGLYELYGNDHEHYHKAPGGKNKTGVGIKFYDGSVVEGEGNQGSNQGELLNITPNDIQFISKHSIKGFNPAEAVNYGMPPEEAFAYQEAIKDAYGIKDDGGKAKYGRRCLKKCGGRRKKAWSGVNVLGNVPATGTNWSVTPNTTASINLPQTINTSMPSTYGQSVLNGTGNIKPKTSNWTNNDWAGAGINAGANLIGGAMNMIGGIVSSNIQRKANMFAADKLAAAYRNLKTIDESLIDRKNFTAPKSLAVVRTADVNINPKLEQNRRIAEYQKREVSRNTLSSAAKLQRFAAIDDRRNQRDNEDYAWQYNQEEQIKQGNAQTITQTAMANADREAQSNREYMNTALALKKYNNNIKNLQETGPAQVYADALTGNAQIQGQALMNAVNTGSTALMNSASGFASVYDTRVQNRRNYDNMMIGQDIDNQVYAAIQRNDRRSMQNLITRLGIMRNNSLAKDYIQQLQKALG